MAESALRKLLRHRNEPDKGPAGKTALFFSLLSLAILKIAKRPPRSFHWNKPSYVSNTRQVRPDDQPHSYLSNRGSCMITKRRVRLIGVHAAHKLRATQGFPEETRTRPTPCISK